MSSIIRADRWQNSDGVAYNSVLQVVSTTKTDTFSEAKNTAWSSTVTGLTVSITPKFASSKILICGVINTAWGTTNNGYAPIRLMRDSTAISVGATEGSRTSVTTGAMNHADTANMAALSFNFLDSPNTISAVVYGLQVYSWSNGTVYVNRSQVDTNASNFFRATSTITVMEIAQ